MHSRPTAVVGGIGLLIAIGFTAGVAYLGNDLAGRQPEQLGLLLPVVAGGVAMFVMGVVDDYRSLSAGIQFAFQVAVALAVVAAGIQITEMELPMLGVVELTPPLSAGLTVLWLVGITNAFNLVDGADGLAAGAAFMSVVAMFVTALAFGHETVALFLGITGAATLGFLHHNLPPASIFLGDSGSQFLGFVLAGLGIMAATNGSATVEIAVPVVAFGLPILDTALAIVRRMLRGESVAKPDRGHIHHRLTELGLSPTKVILLLYLACGVFGVVSLVPLAYDGLLVGPVYGALALGTAYGVYRLRVPEFLELGRLWRQGGGVRKRINRNVTIRQRARELRELDSLPAVLENLAGAFSEAEYDEVELWIDDRHLHPTPPVGSELRRGALVRARSGGFVWMWRRRGRLPSPPKMVNLRAPVLIADDGVAAEITLRQDRSTKGPDSLDVVSESLLPAAAHALKKLRERSVDAETEVAGEFGRVRTADTRLRVASG